MSITKIQGELEIDHERGVIYFHNQSGYTTLRICGLGTIPYPNLCFHCGKHATKKTTIGRMVCDLHSSEYSLEHGSIPLYQLDYTMPRRYENRDLKPEGVPPEIIDHNEEHDFDKRED